MKKVTCPICMRTVTPRKELTNQARIDGIPVGELYKHPGCLTTIWTGRIKCPRCNTILNHSEIHNQEVT